MSGRVLFGACVLVFLVTSVSIGQAWRPVGGSRQSNISGIAVIGQVQQTTKFLVVHDNKKPEQMHATVISVTGSDAPTNTPLKWIDDVALGIEAVSAVPGVSGQFIAFTAAGRAYHIKINVQSATVDVIKSFDVPMIPRGANFEAFDIQNINGSLAAVWAERGGPAKPATIFWSKFDLVNYKFSDIDSATLSVPFPISDIRHISDMKVDTSGAIFVTAASDPGNDGPFSSAFYFAGALRTVDNNRIKFGPSAFTAPIFRFPYEKIEAFDFVPGLNGGLVFGTDNENLGASIFLSY